MDEPAGQNPASDAAPNPGLIMEMLNAHQRSSALKGAIELGLFTAIGSELQTAAELAERCHADPRGMRILCDYLVVQQLLSKTDDRYGLTPTAAVFLDERSPHSLAPAARFLNSPDLINAFRDVAGLVRHGGTLLERQGTTDTEYEGWVEFAKSMVPMMRVPAAFIGSLAAKLRTGPLRVLDIAAGHGLFGIEVARACPQAQIVALDWPNVLTVAEENARAAGLTDRYSLRPGDALQVDLGTGFDLVLLTNFLHHFDRPACESLMRRIRNSLNPGGLVLTLEFVPNEDRVSPPIPATFAFTMLGTTPAGDAFTFAEYEAMFRSAGFASSELLPVPNSPQAVIVTRL